MKATFLDFRRRPGAIIRALERHERVTLTYRGKVVGTIEPSKAQSGKRKGDIDIRSLPMVGMWADREDMKDPTKWVRQQREKRKAKLRAIWEAPMPKRGKRAV